MNTVWTDNARTLVVKIGTGLLGGEKPFEGRHLEAVVKDLARLKRERGTNIIVVSSGAIGCGMSRLGLTDRPKVLPLKQATAAVGQATLMHYYGTLFRTYGEGLETAQVLLTASDLDNRQTYLNVRNTLKALLDLGNVVPIVNENDSTATDELKFGDNDTLAAKIAAKADADLLIILTDVDGLYDGNPAQDPSATLITKVDTIDAEIEKFAEDTSRATSTGGMKTKLDAAKIACAAGLVTIIANGCRPNIIPDLLAGTAPCTTFGASHEVLSHRKRWIAFGRAVQGALRVDEGARNAIVLSGKSLLATGITAVEGKFKAGSAVRLVDAHGTAIARGLVNYSSEDIHRIKGRKSAEIAGILGRKDFDEVIHRDNLVVL